MADVILQVNGISANSSGEMTVPQFLHGNGAPSSELGNDGDTYLDDTSTNGQTYAKSAGAWTAKGTFQGPAGADGTDGTDGADGATGPAGNSLNRPTDTLVSSGGVATIDLADGIEVYDFPLTENVTSWAVSNLPAAGKVAELRVVITQNASPKTCVSPASAGHMAGADTWVVSSVAGAIESLGLAIEHDGTITLFASGVYG